METDDSQEGLFSDDDALDLEDSEFFFQIVSHDFVSGGAAYLGLRDYTNGNNLKFQLSENGSSIDVSGEGVSITGFTFSGSLWLRIRESGGTIYFDTSTDGLSWTNRGSDTVAGAGINSLADMRVELILEYSGINTLVIDNVNTAPVTSTDTEAERDAEISGIASDAAERDAETHGATDSNAEIDAETHGATDATGERAAELEGTIRPILSAEQPEGESKIVLSWTY